MLMVLHQTDKGPRVACIRDCDPSLASQFARDALRVYWRDIETTPEELKMAGLQIGGRGYPSRFTLWHIRAKRAVAAYAIQKQEAWLKHALNCRTTRYAHSSATLRDGSFLLRHRVDVQADRMGSD